jgi:nitroimidazol reductase NimA-like FMN-containing flavoprotein (pyridoxamine 5'-phosphate oxidase superfamily)
VDRPVLPQGYGVPKDDKGLLPWSWAVERLSAAINYWVGTTRPDGRPHAAPVWGVWLDDAFYFEGGPDTRRGRNLAANPAVVVHIERGDEIVIVEGSAAEITPPDPTLAARLVATWGAKYEPQYKYRPDPKGWDEGGLYVVQPRVVIGWAAFPTTTTRWHFDGA